MKNQNKIITGLLCLGALLATLGIQYCSNQNQQNEIQIRATFAGNMVNQINQMTQAMTQVALEQLKDIPNEQRGQMLAALNQDPQLVLVGCHSPEPCQTNGVSYQVVVPVNAAPVMQASFTGGTINIKIRQAKKKLCKCQTVCKFNYHQKK